MSRSRHSVLLRVLAFLFLLRIGFDFGAHGLFPCDLAQLPRSQSTTNLGGGTEVGCAGVSPDHCFCHSLSIGAVPPATLAALTLIGSAVTPLPRAVPHGDRRPLDQPPRRIA